jgi:hypothetical protein
MAQRKPRPARSRQAAAWVFALVVTLAALAVAPQASAFTPYPNTACSGTNPGGTVSYNNCDPSFTLFSNQEGDYTIYKQCTAVGGGHVGPGYIAKFVASLSGRVVTNDIPVGDNRLHNGQIRNGQAGNDPAQGGWGFFTTYLARGTPGADGYFTSANSWGFSNRACRHMAPDPSGPGVLRATPIAIGFGPGGTGNFEEDVVLTDSLTDSDPGGLITLRVRWRIDSSGARLYLRVTESCPSGFCPAGAPRAWVKEPRVSAQMNGQAGNTGWTHYSMFDSAGNKIYGECNRFARDFSRPEIYTQHCLDEQMTRWRLDYGDGDTGGCSANANQPCMNVIGRAISVDKFNAGATSPTFRWKGTGIGFDAWAAEAANRVSAGSTVCGGRPTSTFAHVNRTWELVGYESDGSHFGWNFGAGYHGGQVGIVLKAWEGCTHSWDGTAFHRPLGPEGDAHAVYVGFSINGGWFLMDGAGN